MQALLGDGLETSVWVEDDTPAFSFKSTPKQRMPQLRQITAKFLGKEDAHWDQLELDIH